MKKICAWCDKEMGEIESSVVDLDSHGICGECVRQYFDGVPVSRNAANMPVISPIVREKEAGRVRDLDSLDMEELLATGRYSWYSPGESRRWH